MDEAGRLVDELQHKLAELDRRVWSYRRDMASEFTKYARELLHQVPQDVSDAVSKTIAVSLKDYSSLNPDNDIVLALSSSSLSLSSPSSSSSSFLRCTDIAREDSSSSGEKNGSPAVPTVTAARQIPMQQQRLRLPDEQEMLDRSPHAREKEFHGLFTPTYLPLLDATTSGPDRRSSYDSYLTAREHNITSEGKESSSSNSNSNSNTSAMHNNTSESASAPADLPSMATADAAAAGAVEAGVTLEESRPATPQRKNTDETSVGSDDSQGKPARRSALRRSSSGSISKTQSPRKVRFELQGQEVLPTVEPVIPESALELRSPTASSIDDDDLYNGSMLEMIEDVDEPPPPKRVSSSQALQALSRAPLEEDGTTWTTVTSPPEEEEAAGAGILDNAEIETVEDVQSDTREEGLLASELNAPPTLRDMPRVHFNETPEITEIGDNETRKTTDIDIIDNNGGYNKKPTAATMLEPLLTVQIGNGKSPPSSPNQQNEELSKGRDQETTTLGNNEEEEEEDLFHFDDGSNVTLSKVRLPEPEPESPESPETEKEEPLNLSHYSQSPARPVIRPIILKSASTPSRGIVGSYKGHPFSIPIVSDEIHARAASLGAINTFVGSVNGASGLDEGDLRSFRATGAVASFSGTPKSLSERMMMEELMEAPEEPA
ncbi:hypothetical protein B7463_g10715, partial [Scytalidium lignicola]